MTPDETPDPAATFLRAAGGFADLVERLDGADLTGPGLGDWDLRSLVGHTSRSILTVQQYLQQPAPAVELSRAADYYVRIRQLRFDPADVAERGRAAGVALGDDPATAVRRMVEEVTDDLAAVEGDPVITTIAGGMHLSAYLPTRIFELVENLQYPEYLPAIPAVLEHHHRKLDDGIGFQAETGSLGIDNRTTGKRPAIRLGIAAALGQAAQDAIGGMGFQAFGQLLGIAGTEGFLF